MKRNMINALLALPMLALVGYVCWALHYVSGLNELMIKTPPPSWPEVEARVGTPSAEGLNYEHIGGSSCRGIDRRCRHAAWYDAPFIATTYLFGFDAEGKLVVRERYSSP